MSEINTPEPDLSTSSDTYGNMTSNASGDAQSNLKVTHVAYGLLAWGVVGMFDQSTVPTIFSIGTITLPFIVGGILVHIKKEESKKYWFSNHYRWLILTFWFSILWQFLHFSFDLPFISLSTMIIGALWSVYRIVKGWLYLIQNRPVPNYQSTP